MSITNWLFVIALVASAVGSIIVAMTRVITRLLDDRWETSNERVARLEDRANAFELKSEGIDKRLVSVETICNMRVTRECR